jgi:hypothetical protein
MPGDRAPSLADKARAAKAFVLNKYAPASNEAGPVTQESMDWAQRPDVMQANAAGRLEGGHGTYEDRAAVGLPIPESQDHADAEGFARFAGMGAAGELAAPLVARGVSSVADRARAMLAARQGTMRTGTDPGFLQPVEVRPTRPADFWTPRDADHGDQLFETPSMAERTANIRVPSGAGRLNAEGAKGGAVSAAAKFEEPTLITHQSYLDPDVVAQKLAAKDFTVHVTPPFTRDGNTYQYVMDGHHALEAAKQAGVSPDLETLPNTHDTIPWLQEEGGVDKFLKYHGPENSSESWKNALTDWPVDI